MTVAAARGFSFLAVGSSITGFGRLYNIIPKFNVWNLGTFRKLGVPYFGVLTIRILLSRALK